ncbi:hypothetical protein NL676_012841 [Syzygium grande]|nr:hypothetical protein NL676_012841 [Syzygium grande]
MLRLFNRGRDAPSDASPAYAPPSPSPLAGVGHRARAADPPRLLRREGEVPDGSGGRGGAAAGEGADWRRLRLRPCSAGEELYLEPGELFFNAPMLGGGCGFYEYLADL